MRHRPEDLLPDVPGGAAHAQTEAAHHPQGPQGAAPPALPALLTACGGPCAWLVPRCPAALLSPAGCCPLRVRVWTVVGATPAWSRGEVTSPGLLWAGMLPACVWALGGSASRGAATRMGAHGRLPFSSWCRHWRGRGFMVMTLGLWLNDVCFCCVYTHQSPYSSVNWVSFAFFLLSSGWFLYILTIMFFKWNMLQVFSVVCGFILTIARHPRSQGPDFHRGSGWRQAPSTLPGPTC